MTKRRKITFSILILLLMTVSIFTIYSNIKIGDNEIYTSDTLAGVLESYAILVLGASKFTRGDRPNIYFEGRISAAFDLYSGGKCKKIIVSGDNGRIGYNEPQDMKDALIKMGVPADNIICDYAGFRTLDSVIRMKAIFGQTRGIVVSQKFHNERAIYIAHANGMDLIGFNAPEVEGRRSYKTRFREIFSRVMCVLDVHVFGTSPRFYGEKITI